MKQPDITIGAEYVLRVPYNYVVHGARVRVEAVEPDGFYYRCRYVDEHNQMQCWVGADCLEPIKETR